MFRVVRWRLVFAVLMCCSSDSDWSRLCRKRVVLNIVCGSPFPFSFFCSSMLTQLCMFGGMTVFCGCGFSGYFVIYVTSSNTPPQQTHNVDSTLNKSIYTYNSISPIFQTCTDKIA